MLITIAAGHKDDLAIQIVSHAGIQLSEPAEASHRAARLSIDLFRIRSDWTKSDKMPTLFEWVVQVIHDQTPNADDPL